MKRYFRAYLLGTGGQKQKSFGYVLNESRILFTPFGHGLDIVNNQTE